MVVLAAAVVAFGDMVLVHVQDAKKAAFPPITSVDYRFENLGPIEVTSEVVSAAPAPPIPTLTRAGLLALIMLMLALGTVFLRRQAVRDARRD